MRDYLGNTLLVIAAFLGVSGLILHTALDLRLRRRYYPKWADENCVPVRRLSLFELILLSGQGRLELIVLLTLALELYLCAMRVYGVLSLGQTVGSCATMGVIMLLIAWVHAQNCLRPLSPLLRRGGYPSLPTNAAFRYVHGAWQYADEEWFIRTGNGDSGALRASELDFSAPVLPCTLVAFNTGSRFPYPAYLEALQFKRRNGDRQVVRIEPSDDLMQWISRHEGHCHF